MRRRGLRPVLAGLASLLAHLAIIGALLLVRRGPRPALMPPDSTPFEFEIAISEPAPAPPERRGPPRSWAHAPKHPPVAPARPPSAPPARETEGAKETSPGTDVPPGNRAPDLSLGAVSDEAKRRLAGPAPDADIVIAPRRRPSVDEMRVDLERQQDAVANVDSGRVDPVLYDLLRGARTRFESEARRLADNLALGPGETTRGWGRGYLQQVERATRPGIDRAASPDLRPDAERRRPDVLGGYGETISAANAGAEERWSEICLDIAPGREPQPKVRRGSGFVALDRLALDAFAKAIAARPLPADVRAGLACYEMRISAFRMPPVPMLSCGFGAEGFTCMWPFKRITSVKGRLVSVDRSASEATQAGRSLLRRPR